MISDDNLNKIEKSNLKRKQHFLIDFIVWIVKKSTQKSM